MRLSPTRNVEIPASASSSRSRGAKIPLSGRASVLGEIFLNQSEPHRDVDDPVTGQTFREIVKVNGFGMRFGLSWGM